MKVRELSSRAGDSCLPDGGRKPTLPAGFAGLTDTEQEHTETMTEIVESRTEAADRLERSVVTIGNFDGMHIGHQSIFERAVEEADQRDATMVALTFEPHPERFFRPEEAPSRLSPASAKFELMGQAGADLVVALTFDESLAGQQPEEFVEEILVETLSAEHVVVGEDFRFGKERAGDTESLREFGEPLGLTRTVVEFVEWDGEPVSSTRIRRVVQEGELGSAEAMLGRPYRLYGQVVHGEERGSQMGFPTANLDVEEMAIPPNGVYATRLARKGGSRWRAVTNIGNRPTFEGRERTIETFVLDDRVEEELDLYDDDIEVDVHRRIRDEQRFDDPGELIDRIERDIQEAEAFFDEEGFDGGR